MIPFIVFSNQFGKKMVNGVYITKQQCNICSAQPNNDTHFQVRNPFTVKEIILLLFSFMGGGWITVKAYNIAF